MSNYTVGGNAGVYDVSPDGKRFLTIRPLAGLGETELVVVRNWFQELKQRRSRPGAGVRKGRDSGCPGLSRVRSSATTPAWSPPSWCA